MSSSDWSPKSGTPGGWENSATGCWVQVTNGSLTPDQADLTAGDRAASISFIEKSLGSPIDPASFVDVPFATADLTMYTEDQDIADAVLVYTDSEGLSGFFQARVFADLAEGAMVMGFCPDQTSVDTLIAEDLPAFYRIGLVAGTD
ncbi:hypothetical protein ET445_06155 [Agromyces protaetiae]|uniref:Uncharacterized protein n=1 Tax=Agromyces protaetiae TaxID=2509455 RepID=A0A4P6FGL6_9MICO|nr:hypothetical protein [Agromyces protaetiae]QAY72987.1 hypothetical protein ET445_06155 [Agromyces protaetiae]